MTNQVPAPAHQAFREKRAKKHAAGNLDWELTARYSFLEGMAAEHEVARLMERIDLLRKCYKYPFFASAKEIKKAEAKLAALLEGK